MSKLGISHGCTNLRNFACRCEFMNFSKNKSCLRCQGSRPKRELLPGEWECPSCDFMNFRKNATCYKCRCDRPKDNGKEYEDQIWNSPR
ncbi:hypothetical protein C5167_023006 [Papaver somniferum]|uniref:RanBP2-type domain-containing protein n=1 Tax=Papaver somniferum TaxID=3469 RepID=A0A4Y7JKG2_PAPSO|nr:hypothetical protein C5167_023006 [Papaver somniferum]